jgi:hypothetical protein
MNVFEPAIPMAKVHADLNDAQARKHITTVVIALQCLPTSTSPSPAEAVELSALSVLKIVYEYNVPTDHIFKGNEPANLSKMGNLIDLEQVVSQISTATTVEAPSVEANVVVNPNEMSTV